MHCRPANDFANVGGKIWRILGNSPGSRSGPFIEPSQLSKRLPLIINMLLPFNPRSGLENQSVNPLLSQFVPERTTSSTRADNQHHATVIQSKFSWHRLNLLAFDPVDVVEATMEITAFIIGRPFVSEAGPDCRITVEVKDEVRPQLLKEGRLFDSFKCLQSCLFRETSPRGPCLGVQSLDSVGEKSGQVLFFRRLVVEFSDNVFVELVGNGTMREHGPVDGDELFDEFRMEAMVFISLKSHRNRVGNSDWGFWCKFPIDVMFFWQNDFLGLCRQDLRPERWSGRWLSGQGFEVELIFLNFLCQLNAANRHGRRLESLESEHRPDPLFYPAMVLLVDVIQVLARAYPHAARQGSGRFQFGDRQMRGGVPVQGDHPGTSIIPHCQGRTAWLQPCHAACLKENQRFGPVSRRLDKGRPTGL